ncbi:MAG TPA: TRAM domain-containing protein [Thermoanaerobaculia bacterium]|nr:TRAM domain-containing protein [Thermoanaerobaculia bacterium]
MRTRDGQGGGRGKGPRRPAKDGRPRQDRPREERPGGRPGGGRSRSPSPAKRGRGGEGARSGPPSWWKMPAVPDKEADVPAPPPVAKPAPAPKPPPLGARLAQIKELEVRVEKLVEGGEGLARWEGVPIFIPRSAPGDLAKVRIVDRRPDYGRAEIVEILEPGPARRPDPYPELSPTGICDLQHIKDEIQPLLKAAAVRETLERLGGIQVGPENTELLAGAPWGYRLRTQLHTDVDPMTNGVRVGYYARGTKDLIPITRCALLVPELEAYLPILQSQLTAGGPNRIDVAAGDGGEVTVSPNIPELPHGEVALQVGDLSYIFDARTFFQGHRELLPRLVQAVVGDWEGETAFDLYGGVGLFALALAGRYRKVVTVEGDTQSARYARMNARRNKLTNVEVVARAVETWIPELPENADRVVVDPPRGGLSPKVPRILLERKPKRLTYLSCHPATLARDLRLLKQAYRIEKISLIDLFPQTGHMEALVQMVLE